VKTILVIDDDERIAQALKIRLKPAGYEVLTAADGVYGLSLAMEHKPDLVILDIWMRVGGGFSVAYRLRERAPEVPVIFITASKQAKLREMANNLGAVGFIEKPWQPEELLAAVTLALKGRSASPVTPEQPPEPQSTGHRMATTVSNSPVAPP
jgi:DNA-binding response OmpR family regulator